MLDRYGRNINYMRISITDRCNLNCKYCMPDDMEFIPHNDILRYEEMLRICKVAVSLGITNFKVTGGEPLVRKGAVDFVRNLKNMEGVEAVTLTTNGVALGKYIDELKAAGIDGVNVSLDAADAIAFEEITGKDYFETVDENIKKCAMAGIKTKLNCVLLGENSNQIVPLTGYAKDYKVDVRFIELMPIGIGKLGGGFSKEAARNLIKSEYPDLHPVEEIRGFGPAHYEASESLKGRIGWIDAVSHKFCEDCNRIRLTSTGELKPCLCYSDDISIKEVLRSGADDEAIRKVFLNVLERKPMGHRFDDNELISEGKVMAAIGG